MRTFRALYWKTEATQVVRKSDDGSGNRFCGKGNSYPAFRVPSFLPYLADLLYDDPYYSFQVTQFQQLPRRQRPKIGANVQAQHGVTTYLVITCEKSLFTGSPHRPFAVHLPSL